MLFKEYANDILNDIMALNGTTNSIKTAILALSYTEPNYDTGSFTEPAASTGYERVPLARTPGGDIFNVVANANNRQAVNTKTIFFPKALANYPQDIKYFVILTDGKPSAAGELQTYIRPVANSVPIIEPGNLVIKFV